MSPDEVRSFREVTIQLRNLRSSMESKVENLDNSLKDLKDDIKKAATTKLQIFLVVASTVIGPSMVAAAKYIFLNR